MEQTLRHWCMQDGAGQPDGFVLAGEPELAAAMREALTGAASAETVLASDLKGLTGADLDDDPAAYATCAGALMALHNRSTGGSAASPALRRRQTRTGAGRWWSRVALAALDILLLVGLVAASFGVRSARLRTVRSELSEARGALEGFDVLEEEVQILEAEARVYRSTPETLRAVVEALPNGVTLTDLDVGSDNRVTVQGTTPSVEALSKAASKLETTGMFDELELERVSSGQGGMSFTIRCVATGGEVSGP
ncbi:MAG: PilN domain-containing protein [Candidatus Brocadiia bacterium]